MLALQTARLGSTSSSTTLQRTLALLVRKPYLKICMTGMGTGISYTRFPPWVILVLGFATCFTDCSASVHVPIQDTTSH